MKAFVAWNPNREVVLKSTSGGVFSALAESVIASGGLVVGAVYSEDLSIRHAVAETLEGISPMRGVKYAFGAISKSVYDRIASALSNGRRVLFTGTPCQCAAMRKRFASDANLLLVDLVCFGAPPQSLWLKYVRWLEARKGKRLVSVNPRDKQHGWGRKTYYSYQWADGRVSRQLSLFDPYAQVFYSTLGFRKCCFSCPFRGKNHPSDLTLGDGWGCETQELPDVIKRHGLSLVVCHNSRGLAAFEACGCKWSAIGESIIRAHNRPYFESPPLHKRWLEFNEDVARLGFGLLVKKYGLGHSRCEMLIGQVRFVIKRMLRYWYS